MRQSHMRDKRLCRMELEGHEEEFARFYDMEALAEGSPLWEVEEEVELDEEEEEGEDGVIGEGEPQAWMTLDGEVDFDMLFERGVALGVLSEAELDHMTDQVASGETR